MTEAGGVHANADMNVDVAVVGFGPVGQLLCLLLARRGYRVTALERWPSPYRLPRAVHFDDEIARVLQGIGIRSDSSPIVDPYDDVYEWRAADGRVLLSVDWTGHGPSGWHTANHFSQPELEQALTDLVTQEPNVTVIRGADVAAIDQDADQARCTYLPASGGPARTVTARYVVGCDGANSFVRTAGDFPTTDLGFFFDWLIVDVIPKRALAFVPGAWQLCDPARPTTVTPSGRGRRRWEFMVLPGEDLAELNSLAAARRFLQPWGIDDSNAEVERHAVYRFQALWVDRWRDGRLLLAGDAAHQMPPFAGQGMCSGMRDATALAWKLDLVLSGAAHDALLDTYAAERSPHVQRLIEFSMELGSVICVTDPEVALARNQRMAAEVATSSTIRAPQPRLGAGVLRAGDQEAGWLSVQGRVRVAEAEGLFDDLLGSGWTVLSWTDQASALDSSPITSALGLRIVQLEDPTDPGTGSVRQLDGDAGQVAVQRAVDVDGTYRSWRAALTERGGDSVTAVVVRPDHYVYAVLGPQDDLNTVVEDLGAQVCLLGQPVSAP